MFDPTTAFVGLAGAIVGVGIDSITLYEKLKPFLSSSGPRVLIELGNLGRREKERIEEVYATLEKVRPRAEDLIRKLRNRYLALASLPVILWACIAAAVLLLRPSRPDLNSLAGGGMSVLLLVLGFFSTKLLRSPIQRLPGYRGLHYDEDLEFSRVLDTCSSLSRRELVAKSLTRGLGIGQISASERELVEQFLRLEATVSCLEAYLLARGLEGSRSVLWESFSRSILQLASSTIRILVNEGRLSSVPGGTEEVQQRILRDEFGRAGIEDLLDPKLVGNDFFKVDLVSLVRSQDPKALEARLERFWPVQARN